MPDIHIDRRHTLGLTAARELVSRWAERAQAKFGVHCTPTHSDGAETLGFERSGIEGALQVTADTLRLQATLGLMMKPMQPMIQSQLEAEIDRLLAKAQARTEAR